jgi:hypothetical protein
VNPVISKLQFANFLHRRFIPMDDKFGNNKKKKK